MFIQQKQIHPCSHRPLAGSAVKKFNALGFSPETPEVCGKGVCGEVYGLKEDCLAAANASNDGRFIHKASVLPKRQTDRRTSIPLAWTKAVQEYPPCYLVKLCTFQNSMSSEAKSQTKRDLSTHARVIGVMKLARKIGVCAVFDARTASGCLAGGPQRIQPLSPHFCESGRRVPHGAASHRAVYPTARCSACSAGTNPN